MRLHISPGRHFATDVECRIQEIDELAGNLDIVFVESRIDDVGGSAKMWNWLSAPFLLAGLILWLKFLNIITRVLSGDQKVVSELADVNDAKVYCVDKPIHEILQKERKGWAISNWLVAVVPAFLLLIAINATILAFCLLLAVSGTASLMISYLAGVNTERNLYLVERMADIAEREGVSEACLIVGVDHEMEIREIAERFDAIDVSDGEPNTSEESLYSATN